MLHQELKDSRYFLEAKEGYKIKKRLIYALRMKYMSKIHLPLILILVVQFQILSVKGQVKQIPDFKFTYLQGGGDFTKANITKGKKTLFIFFDTECPHCMQAISKFNENEKSLNNINILLLTKDKKEAAIPFLKNFGDKLIVKKNTLILSDSYNQFIGRFLPRKYPSLFLFGTDQKLIIYSDEEKDIPQFIQNSKTK
ncbi:MAG: hypothetical protein RLZZ595_23 [Bacteroidota bacterium]|jgi:thiol-disulfide isomerase/thioredoxin